MIRIVTLSEFPPDVVDFVTRRVHAAYGMGSELEGEGEIDGQPARAGDAFAVPAGGESFDARGDLRVLRCQGGIT